MTIRIVPEMQMDPALDAEIRRGLCLSFPADAGVFSHTREWHGSRPAWSVVMVHGNQVLAHVGVVDRVIDADGRPVRIAGVQNVYVLPEHRRNGFADQVLAAVMGEAGRQGYECGLLFCLQPLVKVYARLGWRELAGAAITWVTPEGREELLPDKNAVMWHPLARGELSVASIHLRGGDW